MFLPDLDVPSTLLTVSGCLSGHVPKCDFLTVLLSIKLWVAPQSSSASMVVLSCHMYRETLIAIESNFILYMLATCAESVTFRAWHSENPPPYPIRQDTCCAPLWSCFL